MTTNQETSTYNNPSTNINTELSTELSDIPSSTVQTTEFKSTESPNLSTTKPPTSTSTTLSTQLVTTESNLITTENYLIEYTTLPDIDEINKRNLTIFVSIFSVLLFVFIVLVIFAYIFQIMKRRKRLEKPKKKYFGQLELIQRV
jgi:hypothetical protein